MTVTDEHAALRELMIRFLSADGAHGYAGDTPGQCADRVLALMTKRGWALPGAGFDELLAHTVTAEAGTVASDPTGTLSLDPGAERVECIALTFHYGVVGDMAMHSQRFTSVEAIRLLVDQLQAIADQLGV